MKTIYYLALCAIFSFSFGALAQPSQKFIQKIDSQLVAMPLERQVKELRLLGRRLGQKDSTQALWAARKSVRLGKNKGFKGFFSSYLILGNLHKRYFNYDSAQYYYFKVLEDSLNIEPQAVPNAYLSLGSLYAKQKNINEAVSYYLKAVNTYKIQEDYEGMGKAYTNIANIYAADYLDEYPKAISYYNQALANFKRINFKPGLAYLAKAEVFNKMGQKDSALILLAQIDTSTVYAIRYQRVKSGALLQQGKILSEQKEYVKALSYYAMADTLLEKSSLLNENLRCLLYKAEAHYALGNYQTGVFFGEKALTLINKTNTKEWRSTTYKLLGETYAQLSDFKRSTVFLKKYIEKKDSLTSASNREQIRNIEAKYQNREKQNQIRVLSLQNEQKTEQLKQEKAQRYFLITLVALILTFAIFGFLHFKKITRLKQQLLNTEIDELKTKVRFIMTSEERPIELSFEAINEKLQTALSQREFDVLQEALSKLTNKEIADKIHVSVNTVKFHLKNIYEKLGVNNRKEALNFIIKEGN